MKKENMNGLLLAVICIIAGLLSPSNGFDSEKNLQPEELFDRAAVIGISALLIFIILKLIKQFNLAFKK